MPSLALPPGPPKVRGISIAHARNLYGYVRDPLAFVADRFATYGDLYLARSGGELLYVFKHPDQLAEVLVSKADAFRKQDFGLEKVLGRGLLTSDGTLWKQRRRMIQPGFTRARIAQYGAAMVEEAEALAHRWRDGQALDMTRAMTSLTLAIVSRTLFSHRISDETDTVAQAMSLFQESIGTFDLIPDWVPTRKHRRTRQAIADMDALLFGVIDERIAARERDEPAKHDLLDGLLDAVDPETNPKASDPGQTQTQTQTGLDREALRDELITLYMAGHETTANALSWAWLLLARHPEVDARLAAELSTTLGDGPISVEDLERLPYLRAVCHEVLRLYPPAYVLARRSTREVEIGGWTIPANQPVVLWIYMTHHDPRWYPDPERFDPERFLGENERPKLAWLPFGGGARMCVGKHFALMEMQLLLASLVRGFRFEVDPGLVVRPRPRVTLTPAGGLPGRLRVRQDG